MYSHQLVRGYIFGWNSHLQQDFGIELATYSTCPSNLVDAQALCQPREVVLWHGLGPIFGLHNQ